MTYKWKLCLVPVELMRIEMIKNIVRKYRFASSYLHYKKVSFFRQKFLCQILNDYARIHLTTISSYFLQIPSENLWKTFYLSFSFCGYRLFVRDLLTKSVLDNNR